MTDITPFDDRPDPVLGAELRAALDSPDQAAFLARMRGTVLAGSDSSWDLLARWAPRGVMAAAAAAALLWLIIRPVADPGPGLSPPVASAPVQMEVSPQQPEAVVLTVALLEGR